MLYRDRIARALHEKRIAFVQAAVGQADQVARYSAAMDRVGRMVRDEIEQHLTHIAAPGALPTDEWRPDRGTPWLVPFHERWENGEQARAWARETLREASTVAVDGSQLAPSKEYGIPIGIVQVAWFENRHQAAGSGTRSYVKDVHVEIVTAGDLADEDADEPLFLSEGINQRRFEREVEYIVRYLERLENGPLSLVFFDGSLVVSFAGQMRQESRRRYVHAIVRALAASRRRRVPLVGYVDTSFARDLVNMVGHICGLTDVDARIFDALLLDAIMSPLDRTPAFVCARGDILREYTDVGEPATDFSRDVCFVYLKTGAQHPPSRVEFPRWLLEVKPTDSTRHSNHVHAAREAIVPARAVCDTSPDVCDSSSDVYNTSLLDGVIDLVRAEVVVGTGYPYALETADAAAVLTMEDRLAFYRLFQEFAHAGGLDFAATGKMGSKQRRR